MANENSTGLYKCTLCFKYRNDSMAIDDTTKEMLTLVLLITDTYTNAQQHVCRECVDNLQKCYNFKLACLYIESYLNYFIDDKRNGDLDLGKIYLHKNESDNIDNVPDGQGVCRLCMTLVRYDNCMLLNNGTYLQLMHQYFPELDLSATKDPMTCETCYKSLGNYLRFVRGYSVEDIEAVERKVQTGCQQILPKSITKYENDCSDLYLIKTISLKEEKPFSLIDNRGLKIESESEGLGVANAFSETDGDDEKLKCESTIKVESVFLDIKDEETIIEDDKDDVGRERHDSTVSPPEIQCLSDSEVPQYQCAKCNYKTYHRDNYRKHKRDHQEGSTGRTHRCSLCDYETKHTNNLKRHVLVHQNDSEVTLYQCAYCDFKTRYKNNVKKHELLHQNMIFQCKACEFNTKQKMALKRHLLVHLNPSEVITYQCGFCDFKSKYKHSLDTHVWIHRSESEINMYHCTLCKYKTKHKSDLKKHALVHQNISKVPTVYECQICDFKTKYKCNLRKHVVIHQDSSQATLYECEVCKFQTKHKRALTKHMRFQHKSS